MRIERIVVVRLTAVVVVRAESIKLYSGPLGELGRDLSLLPCSQFL